MIVDIDKIVIKDRIRKDFGDIKELADDIKQNGLINPPVVNKEYELLAGERRLRACKSLGWQQIEIRMMDTRDAEHELNVEISENDVRKGFTKSERVDYMKRLLRIEQSKADERKKSGKKDLSENSHEGRSDERTAEQFGISSNTMRKEMSIVDNKDLLTPEDFADWDEGRLSTNKVFKKMMTEKNKLKADLQDVQEERDYLNSQIEEKDYEIEELKKQQQEKVVPDDYEELKKSLDGAKKDYQTLEQARKEDRQEIKELKERIKDLETRDDITELQKKLETEAGYFGIRTYNYIQQNGGCVWITEKLDQLPEKQRKEFKQAVYAADAFIKQMIQNIGGYEIE